jgi:hypothetical protein
VVALRLVRGRLPAGVAAEHLDVPALGQMRRRRLRNGELLALDNQAYLIGTQSPEAVWSQVRPTLDRIRASFRIIA